MATRKMSNDEFIKRWWAENWPDKEPPTWSSTITCAEASGLLRDYYEYMESLP